MRMPSRFILQALAACGLATFAAAQPYPSRPITIVVPFAAGGPLDVLARTLAPAWSHALAQPVVIENVSGASGMLGVERVVRAMPDGYTLSFGYLGTHALNGSIQHLRYDLVSDFEPVAVLPSIPLILAGRRDLPPQNLTELIGWLKGNEHGALIATPGIGSPSHVMGVFLQDVTGARAQFVHYRGGAPALQDLIAGHVDLLVNQPSILLPQFEAGRIKLYAVLGSKHLVQAPGIPTTREAGLTELEMSVWHGLWAPKGTPKPIIDKINAAIRGAWTMDQIRRRLADLGYEIPEDSTPEALGQLQRAEIEKWGTVIRAANIKSE
jgi:tripartite-type tricarboxylate transporter receptor subunit TctC